MNDEELQLKVRMIIAESMRVPLDEVRLDTALVGDLGAESIDFVDMLVGIEHGFEVEFCEEGMFGKLQQLFGEGVLESNGSLTSLGAEVLRARRPEVDRARIVAGYPLAELNALFTTETWVRAVAEVLAARPTACPSCGAAGLRPSKGRLVCDACEASTRCPTQADVLEAWYAGFTAARAQ